MPLVFSSADQSFIQSFQGVEPLYSTLESETLPVRDDLGLPPENRSQLMSNAALTEEDYFVAPPGNVPLSLSKSYTAWPFRVWWRLMVERLGCFGGSPSGCLPMSPGPMWLRWMGRRDTQGTDQSKPDCLIFPSEWVAYFFFLHNCTIFLWSRDVFFFNCSSNFQYQNEKRWAVNQRLHILGLWISSLTRSSEIKIAPVSKQSSYVYRSF